MKLLKLCAEQIHVNKPLPWNVRDQPGHLLLRKGFIMSNQSQVDSLLMRGVFVDQDEFEAHTLEMAQAAAVDPFELWGDINVRAASLLRNHMHCEQFDAEVKEVSSEVQGAIAQDVDAGMFETVGGDNADYSIAHSVQTAFVACLAAGRLGWSEDEKSTLTHAALTMNIAMLDLQNTLVQQTRPLSTQQRQVIDAHATEGRALLQESGVTDKDWLDAVEQHHVTTDGRGLPSDRQSASQIACVIHYADVYLAKISARASRAAIPVNLAARDLYVNAGGSQNPYVAAIIKEMGLYPPGTYVKLANGDTALVVRRGEAAHTPLVHTLMSITGQVLTETVPRDTAMPEYKVLSALSRGQVNVTLNKSKIFGYESF